MAFGIDDFILGSVASGLISGIGSIIGGATAAGAQDSANKANLQAVRETNEQNKQLFYEQLGFNERMVNEANAYNSPVEQRKRLEEAGINPYMVLGNINTGQMQAATAPSPNPMQAAHFEPVNPVQGIAPAAQSLADTYGRLQQYEAIGLDNKLKAIDARYRNAERALQITDKISEISQRKTLTKKVRSELRNLKAQLKQTETTNSYLDEYLNSRNQEQKNLANKAYEESVQAHYEAKMKEELSRVFPQMQQKTLQEISSRIAANRAAANQSNTGAMLNTEKAKTEWHYRNDIQTKEAVAKDLANQLARGQVQLSELGLSDAQLKDLRNKGIIHQRGDSYVFRMTDNAVNWLFDNILGKISLK